jgi:hypothetical protein
VLELNAQNGEQDNLTTPKLKVYSRKKKQIDNPEMEEPTDTQFWMEEKQKKFCFMTHHSIFIYI